MATDEETSSLETLRERGKLLERLTRIQRSISHRAPLQEVMDAIAQGASDLLGDEIAGIRLIDPEDPEYVDLVSVVGVPDEQIEQLRRGPVTEGAGGRAVMENRLVIIHGYDQQPTAIPTFRSSHLQAAMAAPVREAGRAVGSLVVATYKGGRMYSSQEQEALTALAEHASVALTDARTVEAMREAQHAKDMFLAMVSHELKTPLTVIMGTLATFQKHFASMSDELRREMLDSAFERGRDLERQIDRLLQGSRAELAGVKQHIFLPDLIADSTRGFGLGRRLTLGAVPEAFVYTDSVAAQKIIGILLENAVSHSPRDGEICVGTSIVGEEAEVKVTNPGSLPDNLDHTSLYLPFQRGPDVESRGVGLGLYIASRLALSTGGRISAESSNGTVSFTFAFAGVAEGQAHPPP
jgi:K+-sensing histidine kinase KdpD